MGREQRPIVKLWGMPGKPASGSSRDGIVAIIQKETPVTDESKPIETKEHLLIAVFDEEKKARHIVEQLMDRGFSMDMISILGRVHAAGDDVLGIYYKYGGDRIEAWAKQGALWGAIWGFLAGAAGMFILPGVGAVLAAGPIAEAIIGALGGAAVGGAAMSGAAAATHLATAMHGIGIPAEKLDHLHSQVEEGHYLVVLRMAADQVLEWENILLMSGPKELMEFPYYGFKDLI